MSSERSVALSKASEFAGSILYIGRNPRILRTFARRPIPGIVGLRTVLLAALLLAPAAAAPRPVLSGGVEAGERYTRLEADPDLFDALPDDLPPEGYDFLTYHVQIAQPLGAGLRVTVRYEETRRDYFEGYRPFDNLTRSGSIRAHIEPSEGVRVSLGFSHDDRVFEAGGGDNDADAVEAEIRYRPGPETLYTAAVSARTVEYRAEPERDRVSARYRLTAERDLTDRLGIRLHAAAERFSYEIPSPRRRSSLQRSGGISFHYEM